MALQGTLDTFELPDVLRLLASTKKTGRLHLESDRGEGAVWLEDGDVVAVSSPSGLADVDEGLFDLLRAREGGFAFEPGVTTASAGAPTAVEPLLATTEERLSEWREIEAVVPSLHAWVALAPELPGPDVTVDAATWRLVATIGGGLTVGDLAAALGLPEVPVCRVVRDLVLLGLGVVSDAPAAPAVAAWEPLAEVAITDDHGADGDERSALDAVPERHEDLRAYDGGALLRRSYDDPADAASSYDPSSSDDAGSSYDPGGSYDAGGSYAAEAAEPRAPWGHLAQVEAPMVDEVAQDDVDEVTRQLAMLSPRAAQAVAAAAAAGSDTERDAHLEALEDGDEPINRGLLLKFLSSVKS